MNAPAASPQQRYAEFQALGLNLNMQRGQPSDADFDLALPILTAVAASEVICDGIDIRNYPGNIAGLPAAREFFGDYLGLPASQVLVWNNSSLELQAHTWSMLSFSGIWGGPHGPHTSSGPLAGRRPTIVVTTPGYDRHFTQLAGLHFDMKAVPMQPDGPDIDAVAKLAAADPAICGMLFVPTYSNPTGETISAAKARQLVSLPAANPGFTVLADDAYRVHHLDPADHDQPVDLVGLAAEAGNPDRVYTFGSTSKITFAGAGLGFLGTSPANIARLSAYLGNLSIGPNKVEQLRHVKFLSGYPGGLAGLMAEHAKLIAPKFAAVDAILSQRLASSGLATWSRPKGGYFISLDTTMPIADRVIALADAAGVSLTPAGAAFPGGHDPANRNIRLAPTRPPLADVKQAMEVVATCIELASSEYTDSVG